MGPVSAVISCYANIFNFSGRARRAEYWWFAVFQFLVVFFGQIALAMVAMPDASAFLGADAAVVMREWVKDSEGYAHIAGYAFAGYVLLIWLPQLAVTIRRLHDTNRSGLWIFMPALMALAPIGALIFTFISGGNPQSAGPLLMASMILPLIGSIWFLVLMCLPGTIGNNRFGPDTVKGRKRKPPAHPAFAPELPAEDRAEMAAHRKAEIKDYYRKHVLPGIQKA